MDQMTPQAQPQAGQPPQGGQQDMLQMQLSQISQSNPQAAQQMQQAIAEAVRSGELDIPPEMLPQVFQLLQQVAQNPALWPQAYQRAVQMGIDQDLLPPPNSPPDQIQKFVVAAAMVLHQVGQMGQGVQAPGSPGMQTQTAPVQGFADGGVVAPQAAVAPGQQAEGSTLGNLAYTNYYRGNEYGGGDQTPVLAGGGNQFQLADGTPIDTSRYTVNGDKGTYNMLTMLAGGYTGENWPGVYEAAQTAMKDDPTAWAGFNTAFPNAGMATRQANDLLASAHRPRPAFGQIDDQAGGSPPSEFNVSAMSGSIIPYDTLANSARVGVGSAYGISKLTSSPGKNDFGNDMLMAQVADYAKSNNMPFFTPHAPTAAAPSIGDPTLDARLVRGLDSSAAPTMGYDWGGMIGAPPVPMNFNTGDDQLIAAKTGEGVLNTHAVAALGGPDAVNQLNYQASGRIPGGQPVRGMR